MSSSHCKSLQIYNVNVVVFFIFWEKMRVLNFVDFLDCVAVFSNCYQESKILWKIPQSDIFLCQRQAYYFLDYIICDYLPAFNLFKKSQNNLRCVVFFSCSNYICCCWKYLFFFFWKKNIILGKYPCDRCGNVYSSKNGLYQHRHYVCGREAKFGCIFRPCKYKSKLKTDLRKHLKRIHHYEGYWRA